MASRPLSRDHPERVYAHPATPYRGHFGGRPRFYYDTVRGAFYTLPSRKHPRSYKLDVRRLMGSTETKRGFSIHKNGDVYFRGASLRWNVHDPIPKRLTVKDENPPPVAPPKYYEDIGAHNPAYELVALTTDAGGLTTGFYVSTTRGTDFTVTTHI